MMHYGFVGMGFGMVWFWIVGIFFVLAIIWVINRSSVQNILPNHSKSALDILKERYARGEINDEEFEAKKSHLNS